MSCFVLLFSFLLAWLSITKKNFHIYVENYHNFSFIGRVFFSWLTFP